MTYKERIRHVPEQKIIVKLVHICFSKTRAAMAEIFFFYCNYKTHQYHSLHLFQQAYSKWLLIVENFSLVFYFVVI